jgi:hypothetical protein
MPLKFGGCGLNLGRQIFVSDKYLPAMALGILGQLHSQRIAFLSENPGVS